MPKTKLAKRIEWIKQIKSYRNPDCNYPWTLHNLGYCWGWAKYIDGKTPKPDCKYCEFGEKYR